jgi:hypothetical protein
MKRVRSVRKGTSRRRDRRFRQGLSGLPRTEWLTLAASAIPGSSQDSCFDVDNGLAALRMRA